MRLLLILTATFTLIGCVAGAPILTQEQESRVKQIKIFKDDVKPTKKYSFLGEVSAADCSGPGGSILYGNESKSIEILIKKAIVLNADAIVDVNCSGVPYVNNCWLAEKCDGKAISWEKRHNK